MMGRLLAKWQYMCPTMFLFMFCVQVQIPAVLERVSHATCIEEYQRSENITAASLLYANGIPSEKFCRKFVTRANNMELLAQVATAIPSMVTVGIMGAFSDRYGRLLPMMIAIIGMLIQSIVLVVIEFSGIQPRVWHYIVSQVVVGLTGSFQTFLMASFAYAADMTSYSKRTYALSMVEASLMSGSIAGPFVGGVVSNRIGFGATFAMVGAICGIVLVGLSFVGESLSKDLCQIFSWRRANLIGQLSVLFRRLAGTGRRSLIILSLIFSVVFMVTIGFVPVCVLYTPHHFEWTPELLGYFQSAEWTSKSFFTIVFVPLFLRLRISETRIVSGALCFLALAFVLYGVMRTGTGFMLIVIVEGMGGISLPVLRAIFSKCMPISDQGIVFAAIAALECVCGVVAASMFQPIYGATETSAPYAVFFFMAALLMPLSLSGMLWESGSLNITMQNIEDCAPSLLINTTAEEKSVESLEQGPLIDSDLLLPHSHSS